MRILITGLNFSPELTGVGKYTGEMSAYLRQAGHQLRVVTAPPYYPHWRVQTGYRSWQYRVEEADGVRVYRCPLWVPHRPTGLRRLLHLLSFALSSAPVLAGQVFWRPALVLCVAPAFFSAPFAWLAARLCGARAWLHLQDFELDAATSLGLLPARHPLARRAGAFETWMLKRFDRVSTISNRMLARLRQKGVPPDRSCLFPNWVDTKSIHPLTGDPAALKESFGLPREKFVVLYTGSMGHKQGLEVLVESAGRLKHRPDILFVLCGEGSAREGLERAASSLPNVRLLPLQPIESLNALLNAADIHVLPQKAGAADLVMPSKLPPMLASGRAVIATAEPGTEVGETVGRVGVIVPPGDSAALCEAILRLADSAPTRARLGEMGRAYAAGTWSADRVLGEFQAQVEELVQTGSH